MKRMRYPTLYYRVLVCLRLGIPAFRRVTCRRPILDQRKSSRLQEYEQSGYYRVGAHQKYFF
ncbi:MAG: hypothetical protein JSW59_05765 [Phycisphaerales bacterium]|nr:MAG: hypothetical protein JSW59_05765 [Phycisphaerales bacterium]